MIALSSEKQNKKLGFLEILFVVFCLMPFIIPNPVLVTDIQPYAALLGTLVILKQRILRYRAFSFETIVTLTLIVAVAVLLIGGVSMTALRGVYNYYAVTVIPIATILVIRRVKEYPEMLIKALILIWFFVGTVQMLGYRSFASQIISGARWTQSYRGVIGLASEQSFYGIACFYFLHMIQQFKTKQALYMLLCLVMGVLYAQSAMGVIFIIVFMVVLLLEKAKGVQGILVWLAALVAVAIMWYLLETVLVNTRLYDLYHDFVTGGTESITEDASVNTRMNSITDAIKEAFGNYLLPLGFGRRIGSGYGGFLCELGFFALPIMISISWAMALTFQRRVSRILYFIGVTFLLFNNTQIGNPLLLFVVGSNLALQELRKSQPIPAAAERPGGEAA